MRKQKTFPFVQKVPPVNELAKLAYETYHRKGKQLAHPPAWNNKHAHNQGQWVAAVEAVLEKCGQRCS